MRRRAAAVVAALVVLVVLPACAQPVVPMRAGTGVDPTCLPERLILVAQSVPTAEQVPCIAAYPAGWSFERIEVERGETEFALDSDRAGDAAVTVTLTERCDVGDATEIPSDEEGTRRFELIDQAVGRYVGARFYVFDGGCVTYHFDIDAQNERQALANEATSALTFMGRDEVAAQVDSYSEERFRLDP